MEAQARTELDGEYRALTEGAGYIDRSGRGMLTVTGTEAAELLQGQLTNDIEALQPGRGCYAALLDRKGHMQADMRVLRLDPDELWLDTEPAAAAAVVRHLQMYGIGLDAKLEDSAGSRAVTSVIGPGADRAVGAAGLSPEHAQRWLEVGGAEALAVATDAGLDLVTEGSDAADVRRALAEAGAVEVGEEAAETVRVESGRPRFGKEMTTRTIPAEAGINERAVSFTKGCYIGQETVARLHYKGRPNRHLRGLRLGAPVADGDPVLLDERELGAIGTAVVSPAHGPIALAILRREAEPGATVTVGEGIEGKVTDAGAP